MTSTYLKYLDPILEEFTTGEYYREVYNAKKEYFEKAGMVYEDDPEFEQRMCIFMDWYIFDRDLPGVDLPPMKFFFKKNKDKLSPEEYAIYKDLCATHHSLFRLRRRTFNRKGFIIEDLFSGKTFKVVDPKLDEGFNRGDLFEGRLVPFGDRFEFSKGFCFHPKEMESFILNEIKKVRYQDKPRQTKLILQLSNMKLKHLRFKHIDVRFIYSFESKF